VTDDQDAARWPADAQIAEAALDSSNGLAPALAARIGTIETLPSRALELVAARAVPFAVVAFSQAPVVEDRDAGIAEGDLCRLGGSPKVGGEDDLDAIVPPAFAELFRLYDSLVGQATEADDAARLGRGMKALGARLARAVNRAFGRRGAVLRDRYHMRILRTPREVRNALAYVLLNVRKHRAQRGLATPASVDPASSGRWFEGWGDATLPARDPPVTANARSWLLAVGWLRWGRIRLAEVPG
jgi:hypothetical protein